MAVDLEKTVKIIFAGEDQLSKTINSIGGGLDALSVNVAQATQPLADLTDMVLKVDAVLAALAVGGLAFATKTAGQFGDSFNEITTLIEAPADAVNGFRQDIINYARDSTQSIEQINTSIYNAISSGEDYETALDLVNQAEILAVATKADLNQAINVLKPTMNAFGASTAEAGDFADILFTTVKSGKTTLSELEPVLANVTGIASAGGVPFSDLSAAIAGLTAAGAPTAQAVTQIKSALVGILAPTDSAKKAAEALGVELGAEAISAKRLDGVFRELFEATGGNIEQMKSLLPRVEGANAAVILGADAAGKYKDALDAMADRAGAASEAFNKMKDNFALVNQSIINNLKATLIDVGTPLLDEWAEIAGGFGEIFKGVSVGIDQGAFDPVFDLIEQFGQDVAEYLKGVGEAMPEALSQLDWTKLEDAFKALGEAARTVFKDIFGDLDLTDSDDLAAAIQKVINGISNLIQTTAGIVEGLGPFLKGLAEIADKMVEMEGDTAKLAGQIAGIGKGINTVAELIPNFTNVLKILSGSIGLLTVTQIPAFISGLGFLAPALTTVGIAIGPVVLALGALASGYAFGDMLYNSSQQAKALGDFLGEAAFRLTHFGQTTETVTIAEAKRAEVLEDTRGKVAQIVAALDDWPEDIGTEIKTNAASVQHEFWAINQEIESFEGEKEIALNLTATADIEGANQAWNTIYTVIDGKEVAIPVKVKADEKSIEDTKQKIEKATPAERITIARLEGEVDIEIAEIEARAEVLKSAFEWQAKLDIAEVEAGAERLETVANLISESFINTGEVLSDMVGALANVSGYSALVIIEAIEAESRRRDDLLVLQKELTQAEIDLTNARTAKLESGGGLISIEASGVYPELELVLQRIIELAQVRANAEGIGFLLGA